MHRPRLSPAAFLLAVGMTADPTRAELPGIDRSPGQSSNHSLVGRKARKLIRGGYIGTLSGSVGRQLDGFWTFPSAPGPVLDGIVAGVQTSAYRSYDGLFIPGVGLGLLLDDRAFSIDVVPKVATLWGLVGAGVGFNVRNGGIWKSGPLAEGWVAVFGGVRLRVIQLEGESTLRSSASIFFAFPFTD